MSTAGDDAVGYHPLAGTKRYRWGYPNSEGERRHA